MQKCWSKIVDLHCYDIHMSVVELMSTDDTAVLRLVYLQWVLFY